MENILENNKLIAEFLGFELFNNKYYELSQFGYMKTNGEWSDVFYPETLKFHKDWNWLMKVVENIESLGYLVKIAFNVVIIRDKDNENNIITFQTIKANPKKDAIYFACLDFIKWYNLNNK